MIWLSIYLLGCFIGTIIAGFLDKDHWMGVDWLPMIPIWPIMLPIMGPFYFGKFVRNRYDQRK